MAAGGAAGQAATAVIARALDAAGVAALPGIEARVRSWMRWNTPSGLQTAHIATPSPSGRLGVVFASMGTRVRSWTQWSGADELQTSRIDAFAPDGRLGVVFAGLRDVGPRAALLALPHLLRASALPSLDEAAREA